VTEVFVLWIAGSILEWQDRDRVNDPGDSRRADTTGSHGGSPARLGVSLQPLQFNLDIARALETQVSVLLQGPADHLLQQRWDVGVDLYGIHWITVEDGFRDEGRAGALKGQPSRRHLIENDAEREQIRAAVQFLGPRLLGGHIENRSNRYSWAGEIFIGLTGGSVRAIAFRPRSDFGNSEVEN